MIGKANHDTFISEPWLLGSSSIWGPPPAYGIH